MKTKLLLMGLLAWTGLALAGVQTRTVDYQDGDTVLEGWAAWGDSETAKRPGVLIVHQWKGITDYEKKRAEMLAEMGYVVLCADIYGKGVRPTSTEAAGAQAGKYKQNRNLLRQRVNAGLEQLKQMQGVDPSRVAAIGYCFGGTTVLELARSGAEVAGVVSFHGGLDSPHPEDGKKIRAKVLVLHGADDPFVPAKDIDAFAQEMREAKVDWQMVSYGGAVHSFTEWGLKESAMRGAAYDEKADRRSWEDMKDLFEELFGVVARR